MRGLFDEYVALNALLPKNIPLKYVDYGIADSCVFRGEHSDGDCVKSDPRDATVEIGNKLINIGIKNLVEFVLETYENL